MFLWMTYQSQHVARETTCEDKKHRIDTITAAGDSRQAGQPESCRGGAAGGERSWCCCALVQGRLFVAPRGLCCAVLCCVAVLLDGGPDALGVSVSAMWMSRQAWKVGGIGGQGAKRGWLLTRA